MKYKVNIIYAIYSICICRNSLVFLLSINQVQITIQITYVSMCVFRVKNYFFPFYFEQYDQIDNEHKRLFLSIFNIVRVANNAERLDQMRNVMSYHFINEQVSHTIADFACYLFSKIISNIV